MACSWNPELIEKAQHVAAKEAAAFDLWVGSDSTAELKGEFEVVG